MLIRFLAILTLTVTTALCADWNPRLAAEYLDGRQKEWFAWPRANASGVPCVSCHTGLAYLLVRPALRRALGESERTTYETGLVAGLRSRVDKRDAKALFPTRTGTGAAQSTGVEAVLAALFLATEDAPTGKLSEETEKALDRMWSLQVSTGKSAGAWEWTDAQLDPWETADSVFYGASLAALATGVAPSGYQSRPAIRENVVALRKYLQAQVEAQPLHNRLILLWASTKFTGVLAKVQQQAILEEARRVQQKDGGWTLESIGPWGKHEAAPPSSGSNSYATGLVAFLLQRVGVARTDPGVSSALAWLRAHQNPESGFWDAQSMNKRYAPDSMPLRFMRDAATGYAALALLESNSTSDKETTQAAADSPTERGSRQPR